MIDRFSRNVLLGAVFLMLSACGGSDNNDDTQTDGQGGSNSPLTSSSEIRVLSNRADLVSGGDVLVEIAVPEGSSPDQVRVRLNGDDVTSHFVANQAGDLRGLITGLVLGKNTVTATLPGRDATAEILNHPNGGPVFTGPQVQPWQCQESAQDEKCNQAPVYSYFYKSTNPLNAGLLPYDPDNPPGDVAQTTTDHGITVPFIVREEIGYQDRDQYRIVVLFNPDEPWDALTPQPQWNGKVFVPHGGGCGASFGVGSAPSTDYSGTFDFIPPEVPVTVGDSPTVALGRGFVVMSTALANTGHNCSVAMNAESLMMAKERVIEQYGPLRYTIGSGCSGGSIAQQTVANAYPGIYQGLIVTCSYPDTASPGAQAYDYHMLRRYFEDPTRWGPGIVWSPTQWSAVEGHILPVNAIVMDEGLFKRAVDPKAGCGHVGDDIGYHPETNPTGVRCSVFDLLINLFGPRQPEVWSENEMMLGRGFAGLPVDGVGIQYGLEALRTGQITPAMFVDLNTKIGGLDINAEAVEKRLVADDPALANMYRTGWLNSASHLDTVAIIDHGGPDPGIAHDAQWAWAMRERLLREQGHFDNHVIWFGQTPLIGDPNYSSEALVAMDRWLSAVEADTRQVGLAEKIVQNRPGDLSDRCSAASALTAPEGIQLPLLQPTLNQLFGPVLGPILFAAHAGLDPVLDPALRLVVDPVLGAVCGAGLVGEVLRTEFTTPRGIAGQSGTYDDHKCQLKPLNRADDYGPIGFSDAEWMQLQEAFPLGVCDYSQAGVDKQDTLPWLIYEDEQGEVVYGGKPLPDAPANSGVGWASPAFAIFDSN